MAMKLFRAFTEAGETGALQNAPAAVEEKLPVFGGAADRRRLRHVQGVALRGLRVDAGRFVLEIASLEGEAEAEALETSDPFATNNPTWFPVVDSFTRGRQLASFELRARAISGGSALWSASVRLSELEPVCRELDECDPPLPLLTPLLRLSAPNMPGDGWWHSIPSAGVTRPQPEMRRNMAVRGAQRYDIKASDICGAGQRISDLIDRIRKDKAESAVLRNNMDESFAMFARLGDLREQQLQCQKRVAELRLKKEQKQQQLGDLRELIGTSKARLSERQEELRRHREQLAKHEEEREALANSLPHEYSELRKLWLHLRCRRMRMLQEVCQVYPIENCGGYRKIRDMAVGSIEALCRQDMREEKDVSTALGFTAHLLLMVASILEVPLCLSIHNAGASRCAVSSRCDLSEQGSLLRELPLYYAGQRPDKVRFEKALRLLQDGLHQILYSRGLVEVHAYDRLEKAKKVPTSGLLECAEYILLKER
jgi:hypothetical protein